MYALRLLGRRSFADVICVAGALLVALQGVGRTLKVSGRGRLGQTILFMVS